MAIVCVAASGRAGVNGAGTVCVLTFQAKAAGPAAVVITKPVVRNSQQQADAGDRLAVDCPGAAVVVHSSKGSLMPPRERMTMRAKTRDGEAGLTLVELIVTVAILAILASAAVPVARFQVKREKERELRYDLWQMRERHRRLQGRGRPRAHSRPRSTARTIRRTWRRW